MTELVRNQLLTHTPPGRLCAGVLAATLAATLPISVHAAPSQPGPASEPAAGAELPDESLIRAALSDGDLTTARELAVARREAQPSAENYQLEAEVWIALGDYENAKRALAAALEALPDDASELEQWTQQLEALQAASRGAKADEPASSHREAIDQARADRLAALTPAPAPAPAVVDAPKPVEIAKKWYFWVTLGAIVASAGAIAGIAISSTVEDREANNTGSAARQSIPAGGVMFRF